MGNSALVEYTRLSPNCSARTEAITKITPHHMSGNLSVETCGAVFSPTARQASSNYGIDSNGRVGMYVPESKRAWTSSSKWNDQRAVTIEVANSECKAPWPVSGKAWDALVDLCVDIVKRNPGIKRADGKTPGLNYTGDKYGSLTKHKMFANTDCPGSYLDSKMKELELAVNTRLDGNTVAKPSAAAAAQKPAATQKPAAVTGRVADFQRWLNTTYGYSLAVDNKFGPDTNKHAVKALQTEYNRQFGEKLAVDGIPGPATKAAWSRRNIKQGARGNITRIIQGLLYSRGYDPNGFDSIFGAGCKAAVEKFQAASRLYKDGVVGKNTLVALTA